MVRGRRLLHLCRTNYLFKSRQDVEPLSEDLSPSPSATQPPFSHSLLPTPLHFPLGLCDSLSLLHHYFGIQFCYCCFMCSPLACRLAWTDCKTRQLPKIVSLRKAVLSVSVSLSLSESLSVCLSVVLSPAVSLPLSTCLSKKTHHHASAYLFNSNIHIKQSSLHARDKGSRYGPAAKRKAGKGTTWVRFPASALLSLQTLRLMDTVLCL